MTNELAQRAGDEYRAAVVAAHQKALTAFDVMLHQRGYQITPEAWAEIQVNFHHAYTNIRISSIEHPEYWYAVAF